MQVSSLASPCHYKVLDPDQVESVLLGGKFCLIDPRKTKGAGTAF